MHHAQQASEGQQADAVVERSLLSSRSSVKDAIALFGGQHDLDLLMTRSAAINVPVHHVSISANPGCAKFCTTLMDYVVGQYNVH